MDAFSIDKSSQGWKNGQLSLDIESAFLQLLDGERLGCLVQTMVQKGFIALLERCLLLTLFVAMTQQINPRFQAAQYLLLC